MRQITATSFFNCCTLLRFHLPNETRDLQRGPMTFGVNHLIVDTKGGKGRTSPLLSREQGSRNGNRDPVQTQGEHKTGTTIAPSFSRVQLPETKPELRIDIEKRRACPDQTDGQANDHVVESVPTSGRVQAKDRNPKTP